MTPESFMCLSLQIFLDFVWRSLSRVMVRRDFVVVKITFVCICMIFYLRSSVTSILEMEIMFLVGFLKLCYAYDETS